VPALGLDAQLEGDAAQHQPDQHRRDRNVERAEDDAVRDREGDQQQATPSTSQVSFASQNGPIEAIMMSCSSRSAVEHQHADAEVVAVEHHVGEDRHAHQRGEDERQVDAHARPSPALPFPARCVSVTM
jgi:hypothetical protein